MSEPGILLRLAVVALLGLSVVTCTEEGVGPTSPQTAELVVVTPDAGVRAVVVEIRGGNVDIRPHAGYSLFITREADATTAVVVPEAGRTLPAGAASVASLEGGDESPGSLTVQVRQAAAPDYRLLQLGGIAARVAAGSGLD